MSAPTALAVDVGGTFTDAVVNSPQGVFTAKTPTTPSDQSIGVIEAARAALAAGDVLRVFSVVDVAVPVQRQNKRVRIEGEVLRPGEYVLPPNSSIADALALPAYRPVYVALAREILAVAAARRVARCR